MRKIIVILLLIAIGLGVIYVWPILDREDMGLVLLKGIVSIPFNSTSYAELDDESHSLVSFKYKNELPLVEYMRDIGWKYRERLGSGYVFSRAGIDVIVETNLYGNWFIVWELPEETNFELGFYFLKNEFVEELSTNDLDLSEATLMFSEKDIESYRWDSHEIVFKPNFITYLKDMKTDKREDGILKLSGGSEYFNTDQKDYFIVSLHGNAIYSGHFEQSPISSMYQPSIKMLDTESGIRLEAVETEYEIVDKRENETLYELLKELGLIE
ncbi:MULTISPECIES: hypothetical protein [unclassified Fusibacter]|uniref:hypothetical protein n=1 Tax=unclassified Fusibacter TaxID=2624464 RepID=UPI001011EA27|nr:MULTISPECIES: hypothetical protein [unclassified Fusibacter]MCK8058345.1 hypothetical protein [Fusibacter sp. A2]NPE20928.1 hypothetical protein [Fusibacter sp. A1]RXV63131.1 hypothetical protein DWB64_03765 [Fusibacter sp. A1]